MYFKCVLLIIIQLLGNARLVENAKYSLFKVTAFNENERSKLYSYHIEKDEIIFLNGVTNDASMPMDIISNDIYTDEFEEMLQNNDIEYYKIESSNLNRDFYSMINENNKLSNYHDLVNISNKFLKFSSISAWAKIMCRKYNILLRQIVIGKTFEKRDIFVLKLSSDSDVKKPAVFILGGAQGRDWMSPAIILNFIQMILDAKFSLDILFELYDLYFLPVLNPDGYFFSMQNNTLWSKNRKTFFPIKLCDNKEAPIGVNIDRNFYFKRTSSSNECDSVHLGRIAMSEEESLSLASFLNSIAFDMIAFIHIKGFENSITLPYAVPNLLSNNHEIVSEILGYAIKKANRIYRTSIKFDTTAKAFYNNSGNIADWVKKKFNTPVVFTEFITNEQKYFTSADDIIPLTHRFIYIINDTLLLANRIYRPLFNKEITLICNHIILLPFCYISIVFFPQ